MKIITNSETAGRQIRDINPSKSSFNVNCQLDVGFLKTSPIVNVHGGYRELFFYTRSGSEYIVVIEDESELDSYFVSNLIITCMHNDAFAPLKESPFMSLLACHKF